MQYRLAQENDLQVLAQMRWDYETLEEGAQAVCDYNTFISHFEGILKENLKNNWYCWLAADDDGLIVSHIYVEVVCKLPKPQKLDGRCGYVTAVYTRGNIATVVLEVSLWVTVFGQIRTRRRTA